jgi:SAM-dependent methyltransferase
MKTKDNEVTCPISQSSGIILRKKEPDDLFYSYDKISRINLSPEIKAKYFTKSIEEYYSINSDLRWYHPCKLGDSDFYEELSNNPNYYNFETWDKIKALEILKSNRQLSFIDVGCGEGWLVKKAIENGLNATGVDINEKAVGAAKISGIPLYFPEDTDLNGKTFDVLVSLQTLEHVSQPVSWLSDLISTYKPKDIIIAVPAHDTMLGRTNEPLCWPPHHFTLWSEKSIRFLAKQLNLSVLSVEYEPNTWGRFNNTLNREGRRNLNGTIRFPKGRRGKIMFRVCQLLKINWACRSHTLLAHLKTRDHE